MNVELMRLVAEARTAPQDDVIGQLATTELDGDRLSDDELAMFLTQLLVAGNETTRNTISGGLVALAEYPDQWDRLVGDRSLVDGAEGRAGPGIEMSESLFLGIAIQTGHVHVGEGKVRPLVDHEEQIDPVFLPPRSSDHLRLDVAPLGVTAQKPFHRRGFHRSGPPLPRVDGKNAQGFGSGESSVSFQVDSGDGEILRPGGSTEEQKEKGKCFSRHLSHGATTVHV